MSRRYSNFRGRRFNNFKSFANYMDAADNMNAQLASRDYDPFRFTDFNESIPIRSTMKMMGGRAVRGASNMAKNFYGQYGPKSWPGMQKQVVYFTRYMGKVVPVVTRAAVRDIKALRGNLVAFNLKAGTAINTFTVDSVIFFFGKKGIIKRLFVKAGKIVGGIIQFAEDMTESFIRGLVNKEEWVDKPSVSPRTLLDEINLEQTSPQEIAKIRRIKKSTNQTNRRIARQNVAGAKRDKRIGKGIRRAAKAAVRGLIGSATTGAADAGLLGGGADALLKSLGIDILGNRPQPEPEVEENEEEIEE